MLTRLPSRREDDGVIAVIAALLVLVLFGVGALAVDISNAMARRRAVQTTADLAATAGGQDLPDGCAAFTSALDYLKRNAVGSDGVAGDFAAVTAAEMDDGNADNGEIELLNGSTRVPAGMVTAGCTGGASASRVRVTTPPRRVQFGLATAIGYSDVDVAAAATVEIRSPVAILPVFVPQPCSYGSQVIKSTSTVTYNYAPPGNPNGPDVAVVAPASIDVGTTPTVNVSGERFDANPPLTVAAMFTLNNANINSSATLMGTVAPGPGGTFTASYTVAIPSAVSSTVGPWKVRLSQQILAPPPKAGLHWTQDSKVGTLDVVPVAGSCGQNSTGDFGLLQSPRKSGNPADWPRWNFGIGLDHGIAPFPASSLPTLNTECLSGSTLITGAKLDDDPYQDDANCTSLLTGNKVDILGDGLVTGDATYPGRLTKAPSKTCPGPGGGSNTMIAPTNPTPTTIYSTTIDCYLKTGYTAAQLVSVNPPADMLDAAIFDDPRFFYLPVLNTDKPPANGWYPIIEFRAAFITDQLPGTPGSPATSQNGLLFASGKLKEMRALVFDRVALPAVVPGSGNGAVFTGGTRAVRLVE